MNNRDDMVVHLTEASALALEKVGSLELWTVMPTMVRGAKPDMDGPGPALPATTVKVTHKTARRFQCKKRQKAESKNVSEVKKRIDKKEGVRKKRAKKVEDGTVDNTVLDAQSYRRTAHGRDMIMKRMQELLKMDSKAFPQHPIFDVNGCCRMKLQGADSFKWEQIRDGTPSCLDTLPFGSV